MLSVCKIPYNVRTAIPGMMTRMNQNLFSAQPQPISRAQARLTATSGGKYSWKSHFLNSPLLTQKSQKTFQGGLLSIFTRSYKVKYS